MNMTVTRQRWMVWAGVVVGAVVGLAAAAGVLAATRPVYAAAASVLVERIGTTEVSLATEAQLAQSTQTATDAATAVGRSAADIAAATGVEPLPDSSVLLITVEGASPESARAGRTRSPRRTSPTGPRPPGPRSTNRSARSMPASRRRRPRWPS